MHHPNRLSALYRTCRIGAYSYVQPSTAPEHRTTLQSGGTGGTRTTSGKAHLIKTPGNAITSGGETCHCVRHAHR